MTKEDAIQAIEICRPTGEEYTFVNEALDMAIAALRAQAKAEKNEPLTVEELREMDGEPIYLFSEKYELDNGWSVCRGGYTDRDGTKWIKTDYGDYAEKSIECGDVRAYRRKPKEGTV